MSIGDSMTPMFYVCSSVGKLFLNSANACARNGWKAAMALDLILQATSVH